MSPPRRPTNLAASVRARLLDLSRRRGTEFQLVLSEFAVERLLFRIGVSTHSEDLVLKGASVLRLWFAGRHRATWDLDLLARGVSTVPAVVGVVRGLCAVGGDDAILFDPESITGEEIRAANEYTGVRVRFEARLAGARIPMQVDVGFGDAVVPPPTRRSYPTLLDHAPPQILVYPREAIVAEKLEAILTLGVTNSRMKDFYDVYLLATSFPFEGSVLAEAIRATFQRRRVPLPVEQPVVLTPEFLSDSQRQVLWRAFLRRSRLDAPHDSGRLADVLQQFVGPLLAALAHGETVSRHWPPGGPWQPRPRPEA
jgi:hypothetical protein